MIFTRTSSYVIGLNEQSKYQLFGGLNDNTYTDYSENIEIINLVSYYYITIFNHFFYLGCH